MLFGILTALGRFFVCPSILYEPLVALVNTEVDLRPISGYEVACSYILVIRLVLTPLSDALRIHDIEEMHMERSAWDLNPTFFAQNRWPNLVCWLICFSSYHFSKCFPTCSLQANID